MHSTLSPHVNPDQTMAKLRGKNKPGPGSGGHQVAFRATADLYADLECVSRGLGLDISNLVRMILLKHIHIYLQDVERIGRERKGANPDDC
jgi:hypothetical protein